MKMFFKIVAGLPVPLIHEGMGIDATIAATGLSRDVLERLWRGSWGEFESTDAPAMPYHAELREWLDVSINNPREPHYLGPRTFGIYEAVTTTVEGHELQIAGTRVATLTVESFIDIKSAENLAGLVCNAPALWRELRDENKFKLNEDTEHLVTFERVTTLLHDAAGRMPYAPAVLSDDDGAFQHASDKTIAAMKEGGGADGRK